MEWESLGNIELKNAENLWSYITLKGAYILSLKLRGEGRHAEEKRKLLEDITIATKNLDLDHIKEYLQSVRKALLANGYRVKVCKVGASSRVLVGASEALGKIPFEVGLFFDPILNVPFIPGSSLRGAFRHALKALLERGGRNEKEAEKIAETIFGSTEWSGLVGVTDAYPIKPGINDYLFEPDVLTPHYPEAKTELDVSPNPVPFLTIARGVEFEFYIYFNKEIYREESKRLGQEAKRRYAELGVVSTHELKNARNTSLDNVVRYAVFSGDLAEAVRKLKSMGIDVANVIPWIDRAVLYAFARGIGAKTSTGYSRFEVIEYRSIER